MPHRHATDRGFALMTVFIVGAALIAFGVLTIRAAGLDTTVGHSSRRGAAMLYTAEAGIQWAIAQLHSAYPAQEPSLRDIRSRLNFELQPIETGDEACPAPICRLFVHRLPPEYTRVDPQRARWFRLTPPEGMPAEDGRFHVAFREPQSNDPNPLALQIIAVAWAGDTEHPRDTQGAVKAIEATVAMRP